MRVLLLQGHSFSVHNHRGFDPQYYESDSHFCLPLRCDDKNIKYKWVCSRDPLPSKQKWYLPDASDVEEAVGTPKRKRKFHWKEV